MSRVVEALGAALEILAALGRITARLERVRDVLEAAHREGRDLTDAEVEALRAERRDAVEAWRAGPGAAAT